MGHRTITVHVAHSHHYSGSQALPDAQARSGRSEVTHARKSTPTHIYAVYVEECLVVVIAVAIMQSVVRISATHVTRKSCPTEEILHTFECRVYVPPCH